MSEHDTFGEMLARRAELSPEEETRLQAHIRNCPGCAATATAYARQSELLRSLPQALPPPSLRARVLEDIHRPTVRPWVLRPAAVLAAPALAAVLVLAALAYTHHPGGKNHSAAPAATPPTVPANTRQVPVTSKSHPHAGSLKPKTRATHRRSKGHVTSRSQPSAPAPVVAQVPPAPYSPGVAAASAVPPGGQSIAFAPARKTQPPKRSADTSKPAPTAVPVPTSGAHTTSPTRPSPRPTPAPTVLVQPAPTSSPSVVPAASVSATPTPTPQP